jgi:spore germination cell wall hydrolase CwlJ-like protein
MGRYIMLKNVMWGFVLIWAIIIVNSMMKQSERPEPSTPIEELIIEDTKVNTDEMHCLAMNIYHEARGESFAGKVAVADVVMNRVQDSRYPDTICGVVHQAKLSKWHKDQGRDVPIRNQCQFSWCCDGRDDAPIKGFAWDESNLIAHNFIGFDTYQGITEGATHYHTTYVDPYWASSKGMRLIGQIGEHLFYRWQ